MIVILGKGILGLSVAEFLSRTKRQQVVLVSSADYPSSSTAAAANLATKSQVFARDPHFALKLQSKKFYPQWLSSLLKEAGWGGAAKLAQIYVSAKGRDVFDSEESAQRQWDRIVQPHAEISERGLQAQDVRRTSQNMIEYGDEAWVSAGVLLALLEEVLRSRGVKFIDLDASNLENLRAIAPSLNALVVCAGSQTPALLNQWKITDWPATLLKRRRWSFGGTLEAELPSWRMPDSLSLLEYSGGDEPEKVTISGADGKLYCSSVSVKCEEEQLTFFPALPEQTRLVAQQEKMTLLMRNILGIHVEHFPHRWRWGWRLGFGHNELVIETLSHNISFIKGPLVVAAGAHKSGFLFAPSIGSLVGQKLQA